MMVGREVILTVDKPPASPGEPMPHLSGVSASDHRGRPILRDLPSTCGQARSSGSPGCRATARPNSAQVLTGLFEGEVTGSITMDGRGTHRHVHPGHPGRRDSGTSPKRPRTRRRRVRGPRGRNRVPPFRISRWTCREFAAVHMIDPVTSPSNSPVSTWRVRSGRCPGPRRPQDLARPDARRSGPAGSADRPGPRGHPGHGQHRLPGGPRRLVDGQAHLAAHHQPGQVRLRGRGLRLAHHPARGGSP